MRIAFGIYRLQPRGGLEDHCLRIAQALADRGHEVTVFTARPAEAAGLDMRQLRVPRTALSNHARMEAFARSFRDAAAGRFGRTVSFQPVPGVDVLFCAEPPRGISRPFWAALNPRHRIYAKLEEACFAASATTRAILLSPAQARGYASLYETPPHRIAVVPPSIDPHKRRPELRASPLREATRAELGIAAAQPAWLWLGLQPQVKGLDRVLAALAEAPDAVLAVGGIAAEDRKAAAVRRLADRAGLAARLCWLGYLQGERLLAAFAAADVLAHPARLDVTGATILEAIINGLPAAVTANCGFAHHVAESGAGMVLPAEVEAGELAAALRTCTGASNPRMSDAGCRYGATADLYGGIEAAASLIEADAWPPYRGIAFHEGRLPAALAASEGAGAARAF